MNVKLHICFVEKGDYMKKYCLYLDESGDFSRDLKRSKRSLVGGILCEDGAVPKDLPARIYATWEKEYGEWKDVLNHCTELRSRIGKTESAILLPRMISDIHNAGYEFVIFEYNRNIAVVDSNITYLNTLAGGISQIMRYLSFRENGPIQLHCIIGRRKNTEGDKYSTDTIPDKEYKSRLDEKIALDKAKIGRETYQKSVFEYEYSSDKKDVRLILADYVCNFWFSGIVYIPIDDDERQLLRSFYKEDFLYSIFQDSEEEYVKKLLSDGVYSDLLYGLCNGSISLSRSRDMLLFNLGTLPHSFLINQLDGLINNINNFLQKERDFVAVQEMLGNAKELASILEEKNLPTRKFRIDIGLLYLAILNHEAKLEKMVPLFDELTKEIQAYSKQNMDISYMVMLKNRQAVYYQDIFDFQKSISVCTNLESVFDVFFSAMSMVDEIGADEQEIYSEELGKVLGTKVQAYVQLVNQNPKLSTEALNTSDKAMRQFTRKDDLNRQYQYRSNLESALGHPKEAMEWLEKYFGTDWKSWLKNWDGDCFGLSHILKIAVDQMAHGKIDEATVMAQECIEIVRDNILSADKFSFPEFLILIREGRILLEGGNKNGKEFLNRVKEKTVAETDVTFRFLHLEALLLELKADKEPMEREIRRFLQRCEDFLKLDDVYDKMKDVIRGWKDAVEKRDLDEVRFPY